MTVSNDNYFRFGFITSFCAHIFAAVFAWLFLVPGLDNLKEPIVYSISLEGGSTLGGIAQVPVKESVVSPIKKVSVPDVEQPKPTEEKPPVKDVVKDKPEEELPDEDDGDIQVSKPTPTPKVVATPKPTTPPSIPTPQPTSPPKPTEQPTAKPTAKVVATEPAKSTPTARAVKAPPVNVDKQYQQALQRYLGESSDGGGSNVGSASNVGKGGRGGGVVKPREFFEYSETMRRLIKNAWNWYDSQSPLTTTIRINMARDGLVEEVKVVRGSGNNEFDNSVVRAVRKVNRFPAPPAIIAQDFRDVEIEFTPKEGF